MNPCKRMEVWAYGVDRNNNHVVSFNGNENECTNEIGNCGCLHAEHQLLNMLKNPLTVTISHSPCLECAKKLYAAGVESIMYHKMYRDVRGIHYLRDRGITVRHKDCTKLMNTIIDSYRREMNEIR